MWIFQSSYASAGSSPASRSMRSRSGTRAIVSYIAPGRSLVQGEPAPFDRARAQTYNCPTIAMIGARRWIKTHSEKR